MKRTYTITTEDYHDEAELKKVIRVCDYVDALEAMAEDLRNKTKYETCDMDTTWVSVREWFLQHLNEYQIEL